MSEGHSPVEAAILAVPESTASVVYGMYDLFMSAGRDWNVIVEGKPGRTLIRPRIASRQGGPFQAANDVPITPHVTLEQCVAPAVVCVPEVAIPPGESFVGRFTDEIAWLQRCYSAGATLATACSGAMLLAEAGLLDGHEATTHWAYCEVLAARHPKVKVRAQRALVISGNEQRLVMAGGGTSWLDLGLYLIARAVGIEAAMQTARVNLIDWHHIGQQPFARLARSRQVEDAAIAGCQTWVAEHYPEPAPVAAMVRLSGLPERSFKRRFRQATGMSPLEYVHTVRLEEAKQILETSDVPVDAVASQVGYEDAGFFSRLFRRHVNLTPAQYRKRFGAMRRALKGG
ncbi:MAG TPA: helix-turn-helix domain-containing protein [Burkholderiales bacterium]|nr:helix-turn-helix domain-containing protein [Burkholderiales bacterium]